MIPLSREILIQFDNSKFSTILSDYLLKQKIGLGFQHPIARKGSLSLIDLFFFRPIFPEFPSPPKITA